MKRAMIKTGQGNSVSGKLAEEISYEDLVSYGKRAKQTYFHFEEVPDFPFPGLSPTLYPIWEEGEGDGCLVLYADYNFLPQAALYLSVNIDYLMEEMEKVAEQANNDAGHQMFEIAYAAEEDYDYMISTGVAIDPEEASNLNDYLEFISLTYIYPLFVSSLRFAALRHQEDLKQLIEDMNEIMYEDSENQSS
ncbi:hypothetical protein F7984_05290 [Pradoshia sp. D12]|uniref:hypothetical protein n=1 Tax=Bacillaceae TaxID=186817 RepID=UPI0011226462|nr:MULTISPECIES: hypothetical protein [Bacillaceae]QFK70695.1 hypothetical protein F7984_05290 [Pradoshia sp. D12]TPF72490.1 hypothetical protein FHY44_01685 [Bacillus sp. D12]